MSKASSALVVGYRSREHNQERNVIGRVRGVVYKRIWDLATPVDAVAQRMNRVAQRLVGRRPFAVPHAGNRFVDLDLNDVSLCHLFNAVSYGHRPWVVTCETVVPRFATALARHHGASPSFAQLKNDHVILGGMARLAGSACKRIIALSECTAAMQRELLLEFPRYQPGIDEKIVTIHAPQARLVSAYADKRLSLDGPLELMLVGKAFFRKGGVEVIETLKKLRDERQYDIELTIVSSLGIDNYATAEGVEDVRRTRAFIAANASWIKHFERLPNAAVLAMMKHVHVGLLPTYADSYGYSVLEFQASGCPVISTNVRAMPEINDNERGWVIDVPKNRMGEAIYTTQADRDAISLSIRQGLERALHEIVANRAIVSRKADNAIASIAEQHDPARHAAKLEQIYVEAVADRS